MHRSAIPKVPIEPMEENNTPPIINQPNSKEEKIPKKHIKPVLVPIEEDDIFELPIEEDAFEKEFGPMFGTGIKKRNIYLAKIF